MLGLSTAAACVANFVLVAAWLEGISALPLRSLRGFCSRSGFALYSRSQAQDSEAKMIHGPKLYHRHSRRCETKCHQSANQAKPFSLSQFPVAACNALTTCMLIDSEVGELVHRGLSGHP